MRYPRQTFNTLKYLFLKISFIKNEHHIIPWVCLNTIVISKAARGTNCSFIHSVKRNVARVSFRANYFMRKIFICKSERSVFNSTRKSQRHDKNMYIGFLIKIRTAYIREKCEDRLLHLLAGLPTSSFQSPAFAFMRHTGPQRSNLESRQTVLRNRASNRGPLLIRASWISTILRFGTRTKVLFKEMLWQNL